MTSCALGCLGGRSFAQAVYGTFRKGYVSRSRPAGGPDPCQSPGRPAGPRQQEAHGQGAGRGLQVLVDALCVLQVLVDALCGRQVLVDALPN